MSRKALSRNAPCPCGSGRKYKGCCLRKGIEYEADDTGRISQVIPLTDDMAEVLAEQRRRFVERFGREPGPDDPVFFDLPHPEHLEAETVAAMRAAGLDPAYIHAYERTGRLVTQENQHLIPEAALDEWDAAIREYDARHGPSNPVAGDD